jgi:multidrug transporter EmrE-like cation transporter
MNQYQLILLVTIIGLICTLFVKKFCASNNNIFIILIIIFDIIYLYYYLELLKQGNVSSIYALLKIFSLILIIIFGMILFNESISLCKIGGIIFSILSIYLLVK